MMIRKMQRAELGIPGNAVIFSVMNVSRNISNRLRKRCGGLTYSYSRFYHHLFRQNIALSEVSCVEEQVILFE